MHAPPEFEEHVADRSASRRAVGTLSVRVIAAHEHDQDTVVLSVRGDIDIGTAPMLGDALRPSLERGTGALVLDLCEVPFMDSTGVHVLVDALQRLKSQNRRFALVCHEHDQVHKLLDLVGLLDAMAVYGSRLSAVIGGEDRLGPQPTELRPRRSFGTERPAPQAP